MGQIIGEGITFDDVLLVPSYSQVIPNQVDLTTNLTKKIRLNIPMMSAGMDTVSPLWYALGRYVYVPCAIVLCCVALFLQVAF